MRIMTLVLSCVTPDCVYQVSDRRLTWLNGPQRGQVKDDDRNKAVLVDGRFAFGYTGLAEVGTVRTDDWLADVVAKAGSDDMSKILARIRDSATESFRAIRLPAELKRHAFQGVGWVFDKGFPQPVPGVLTVTNAIESGTKWLPAAQDIFRSSYKFFPYLPDGFELMSVGQELSRHEHKAVWRLVRRSAKRHAPPGAYLRSLLFSMRWLAHRHPTIGPGFMALSIAKKAAERTVETGGWFALMSGPREEVASFLCFGPDGLAQLYGPHAAMRGMSMRNFTVMPLSPKSPASDAV